MNVEFQFDEASFREQAKRLAAFTDKGIEEVIRDQAGLGAMDVQRLTPPHGEAPLSEGIVSQRRAGENAVRNDIRKLFMPLTALDVISKPTNEKFSKGLKSLIRKGNYPMAEVMLRRIRISTLGIVKEATAELLDNVRDKRGRVRRSGRTPYIVVSGPSIKRLLALKLKRVGLAKSGWNQSLTALGRGDRIPAWVRSQSGDGVFNAGGSPGQPEVTIGNAVRYAQRRAADILPFAYQNRIKNAAAQANRLERILRSKLKQEGLQ